MAAKKGAKGTGKKAGAAKTAKGKEPKEVLFRIDPDDDKLLLKDILLKIQELQKEYPDLDVFFDGDEYAICGREKKD